MLRQVAGVRAHVSSESGARAWQFNATSNDVVFTAVAGVLASKSVSLVPHLRLRFGLFCAQSG